MKQDQLLDTVMTCEKYTVNNGALLVSAYLLEWFRVEEDSTTGRLLTLLALSLVTAHHAADVKLKAHLAHHIAQLWMDTYATGGQDE